MILFEVCRVFHLLGRRAWCIVERMECYLHYRESRVSWRQVQDGASPGFVLYP